MVGGRGRYRVFAVEEGYSKYSTVRRKRPNKTCVRLEATCLVCLAGLRLSALAWSDILRILSNSFIQSHRVSKEKANSFQIDPDNSGPYIPESITTGNNNPASRCICIVYTVLQFNYVFIEISKTRPT